MRYHDLFAFVLNPPLLYCISDPFSLVASVLASLLFSDRAFITCSHKI